jgi:hypothetical protein
MNDAFYEESVSPNSTKFLNKMSLIFRIISIFFYVIFVLILFFILISFYTVDISKMTTAQIIISIFMFLFMLISSILTAIFFQIKKDRLNISFDYTFVSGELRISKVFNGKKRKSLYILDISKFLQIGKYNSNQYKKIMNSPQIKEEILTPNKEPGINKDFYYLNVNTLSGKKMLIIECREILIANVLRSSRTNILEKDFKK